MALLQTYSSDVHGRVTTKRATLIGKYVAGLRLRIN